MQNHLLIFSTYVGFCLCVFITGNMRTSIESIAPKFDTEHCQVCYQFKHIDDGSAPTFRFSFQQFWELDAVNNETSIP